MNRWILLTPAPIKIRAFVDRLKVALLACSTWGERLSLVISYNKDDYLPICLDEMGWLLMESRWE